ncbi:ABC-2 transporter permease [Enterococcus saccharolyticus]|uniref:ABC-2 transporter permease n=1 Tax=Candidatus Enterococcus willemsii TaxID=1857215 RepID=A0ABQ6YY08_9ENTE|nr:MULTISPECIES: ABC-2 transporter permease [Enterococcus]KAF1302886.1 hypothetical protein BAU17_11775 [Enterococcus sp. CU12B]MCD5000964.1 ABC-2 transporter permease [Enterococcus saccharolyticus]
MRSLWMKDYLLLKKQFMTYLIFLGIAIFNIYATQSIEIGFLFLSFGFVSLAVATLYYDQENEGLTYLFSLPITKGQYVVQKELLILFSSLVACLIATILAGLVSYIHYGLMMPLDKLLLIIGTALLLGCFYGAIVTPLYLKFNSEQARVVMFLTIGGFVAVGFLVEKTPILKVILEWGGIQFLTSATSIQLSLLLVGLSLLVSAISAVISHKIIKVY